VVWSRLSLKFKALAPLPLPPFACTMADTSAPAAKRAKATPAGGREGGVLVLDFGSQYTQLITRRVRELGVYSALLPGDAEQVAHAPAPRLSRAFPPSPPALYRSGAKIPSRKADVSWRRRMRQGGRRATYRDVD
jgi:hypothetical protein